MVWSAKDVSMHKFSNFCVNFAFDDDPPPPIPRAFTTQTSLLCHHRLFLQEHPFPTGKLSNTFSSMVSSAHINWCWCSALSLHHYHNLATSELIRCCKSISLPSKLAPPVKSLARPLNAKDVDEFHLKMPAVRLSVVASARTYHSFLIAQKNTRKPDSTCIKKRIKKADYFKGSLSLWSICWRVKYSLLFRCAQMVEKSLPHPCCGLHLITHLLLQASPRGLHLRCPAVSSGAPSEESAEQLLHFWSHAGES